MLVYALLYIWRFLEVSLDAPIILLFHSFFLVFDMGSICFFEDVGLVSDPFRLVDLNHSADLECCDHRARRCARLVIRSARAHGGLWRAIARR